MTISTTPTDRANRYFALATHSDVDAYFAQFTADATVEDEGHVYRGIGEIRGWRDSVPAVTYTVRRADAVASDELVVAEISGEFPGSPVDLTFRFTFAPDGRIQHLTIRV